MKDLKYAEFLIYGGKKKKASAALLRQNIEGVGIFHWHNGTDFGKYLNIFFLVNLTQRHQQFTIQDKFTHLSVPLSSLNNRAANSDEH